MDQQENQFGTLEVARFLGVSAMTVVRWIDKGLIPAHRTPGNHRRIRREDLVHFIRRMGFPFPPELALEKKRVLVVDDEPEIIHVIHRGLDTLSDQIELYTARDGVTAMIEVGRIKPDMLLLDLVLPGLNGVEVCRRIKSNPHLSTRIVAISGKASDAMKDEVLQAGADLFLAKPVSIHRIRMEVADLIQEVQE